MPQQIGAFLNNRYRIKSVIAHGGMGAIYWAYDESLGVDVAVKENLFSSEEAIRQFRREATLLAALRHPNLPRVTDHFVINGQGQYLVMDYIEGADLRQRLGRQSINEEEAVAIGVAVCGALTYLHSRTPPVVHRDIKPGNVKITPIGQVFLVDFGLAKISKPGQATTTGAQALTPGYAPPEQYGQGTTPSSDIYSLGATLYAAMTGKIPEDGLARAMGSAVLTPLRTHNPALSDRIEQVIQRAMAIRPADRYPGANDFRLALLSASPSTRDVPAQKPGAPASPSNLESQSTVNIDTIGPLPTVNTPVMPTIPQAQSPQAVPHTPRLRKSAFLPIAGILIVIGVITAGILFLSNPQSVVPVSTPILQAIQPTSTLIAIPPTPTQPAPTLPPPTSTSPPPTATFPVADVPSKTFTPAVTPVGGGKGQIAFVSLRDNNLPQIFVMNSDGKQLTQITKLPDGACQPDWSPDGKRLVFVSPCRARQNEYRGSTLYIINADGSGLTLLPSMPGGDFDPAWSPDGQQIAFTSLRETIQHIFLINLNNNKVTRISAESSFDGKPAWSPDSKNIAFESTRLGSLQIWVVELASQNTKMISIQSASIAFSPQWSRDGLSILYHRDQAIPSLHIKQFKDMAPEFTIAEQIKPIANANFSTDGLWIVFDSWKNNNNEIFLMASNGSNLTQLTTDPGLDFSPVWRP